MLEHISKPANRLLNKIANRRIGETLEALEKIGCGSDVKDLVKKNMWNLKDEAETILSEGVCDGKSEN